MRLNLSPEEINTDNGGHGLEVSVAGYRADIASKEAIQVYIEEHNGELCVHVWNGGQEPETITIEKDTEGEWHQ